MPTNRIEKNLVREFADAHQVKYTVALRHLEDITSREIEWGPSGVTVPVHILDTESGIGSIAQLKFDKGTGAYEFLDIGISDGWGLRMHNSVWDESTGLIHMQLVKDDQRDMAAFTVTGEIASENPDHKAHSDRPGKTATTKKFISKMKALSVLMEGRCASVDQQNEHLICVAESWVGNSVGISSEEAIDRIQEWIDRNGIPGGLDAEHVWANAEFNVERWALSMKREDVTDRIQEWLDNTRRQRELDTETISTEFDLEREDPSQRLPE